jgi:four helix bundle protein
MSKNAARGASGGLRDECRCRGGQERVRNESERTRELWRVSESAAAVRLCSGGHGTLKTNPLCYRLVSQQMGSADSICANIEEGYGRLSRVEYVRFLDFARGSTRETRGRYERMKRLAGRGRDSTTDNSSRRDHRNFDELDWNDEKKVTVLFPLDPRPSTPDTVLGSRYLNSETPCPSSHATCHCLYRRR